MKIIPDTKLPDYIPLTQKSTRAGLNKTEPPANSKADSVKEAAQNFESIFITYLFRSMRETVPKSSLFGGGVSGDIYTSLFDENISGLVARKGGIGLADIIVKSLQHEDPNHKVMLTRDLSGYRQAISNFHHRKEGVSWDREIIQQAATHHDVDPKLVEAVIRVESGYRADAVSQKGAVGLMQLMASTARDMGVQDRTNPRENVFGGVRYLKQMLNRFHGDLKLALSAYNAGPSAVEKHNGIPPYPETRRYVQKVMQAYREL